MKIYAIALLTSLAGITFALSAYAADVITLPPGTYIETGYLENRVAWPGGQVRVTVVGKPFGPPLYGGMVATSFADGVLEIRMRYVECEWIPCPLMASPTLSFPAPQVPGVYPVKIIYVFVPGSSPDQEEFVGTDTLTVRGTPEPIPAANHWVLSGLALLLGSIALRFLPKP